MAALAFTAQNISADPSLGALIRNYEAAEAGGIGDAVYLSDDDEVSLAQADAALAASRAIGIVVAIAKGYGETTFAIGDRVSVCVFGDVYGFTSLAEGTYGYVSNTAGDIDDSAGTPNVYVLGQARRPDTFFVNPGITPAVSV